MNKRSKLKLIVGVIFVIIIVAALFVYLDFSMSRKVARETYLAADSFTVGLDYSGIIEEQYIQEGDKIENGDELFKIRSSTLSQARDNDDFDTDSLLYTLDDDGTILVTSAADGQVQEINYSEGAFVPANSTVATINTQKSLYVIATYALSSPDYGQLTKQNKIDVYFPDGTKQEGEIFDIALETSEEEVLTIVKARVDETKVNTEVFTVGTPLESTLYLDTDTWYEKITNFIKELFQPRET